MNLLTPLGLAALAALPVIVLFHMRHTTPERRPVPSLRFWAAANPRPADERRLRRPPLTLPLVLQLIAAAAIALALARPATAAHLAALAPGLRSEPRHVIVLLDGSTSMGATIGAGSPSRWELARRETIARLAPLREGDVATLILMGTRPVTLTATDAASLIALRERLATIAPPGGRADLDGALALAGDLLLPNLERHVVVISDGALTADATTVANVAAPVELMLPGAASDDASANLAVVDIAARPSPNGDGTVGLYTSVMNFGPQSVTTAVSLLGDGLEVGRSEVTLAANGGTESLRWLLPPGVAELTVRIEHPDALAADDVATLLPGEAATTTIVPRILLVSDLPGALARALMAVENVLLTIEPSDNGIAIAGGGHDLIVFDRTAPATDTLDRIDTASLWVAPPVGGPFATTEGISDPEITRVRAGDPLLEGVDLSGATFGPTPVFTLGAGDEEVVGGADGPLLFRSEVNTQPALVLAIDPEASNLPKRVAFPVLVANAIAALAPDGIPAAIPLGEPLVYEPRAATVAVEIAPPAGEPALLQVAAGPTTQPANVASDPVSREIVYADTGAAGTYTVTERDESGRDLGSTRFVVNAGHPRESDLRVNAGLAGTLASATGAGVTATRQERVDLWPLLALLALIVIALEWAAVLRPGTRRVVRRLAKGHAT
ncbi:MAG: VWA domain-containing protein [Chloroflexia bacterium]|nr:VWA domain-containing protein [Chloroflexia bacterium]